MVLIYLSPNQCSEICRWHYADAGKFVVFYTAKEQHMASSGKEVIYGVG